MAACQTCQLCAFLHTTTMHKQIVGARKNLCLFGRSDLTSSQQGKSGRAHAIGV
ncbi:hypothetical protein Mapa_006696 [Marchantia paleacea]|nr:hypothetical protein Mapa_006696 [Marchantia paleacea]